MSDRTLLITFDHQEDLLGATDALRRRGYRIRDAYTPHAVHGLDRAMGLRPSRLTWACFIGGLVGTLGMLWFEHFVAAVDWPIDVGGKPWNSLPSDVPVAFEAMVFVGAFSSVLAMLGVCRLWPGRQARLVDRRVTDDLYALVLEESNAAFDLADVRRELQPYHATRVEEMA